MRWHYRLGHLSFPKLKTLAKNGEIPRRLAKAPPPKCAGRLFGAMTKLPWRSKESKSSHEVFTATKPGECISVDHMISTHVGFFAQLKGKLTSKQYRAASIFVDHFSRLRFVHLIQDLSSDETINTKEAFELLSSITIAIMVVLQTTPSNKHANKTSSNLPSAGSMHTFKMGLRSVLSGTSRRVPENNSGTLANDGQRQCTQLCGRTRYAMRR